LKNNKKEKIEVIFEFDMNDLFKKIKDLEKEGEEQGAKGAVLGLGNLRLDLINKITEDLSKKGGKGPSTPYKKRN